MEEASHALVLVEVPLKVSKGYHYAIPPGLQDIQLGSQVLVPFGKRQVIGYVLAIEPLPQELKGIKEIRAVLRVEPVFTPQQLHLAQWLADYCLCPLWNALQTVVGPEIQNKGNKMEKRYYPNVSLEDTPIGARAIKQRKVWEVISASPGLSKKELASLSRASVGVIDAMVAKGYLWTTESPVWRNPYPLTVSEDKVPLLHQEQVKALQQIDELLVGPLPKVVLLHGVTGSGKTEVYLQTIERVLEDGREALCLVPEISLTPQMILAFQARFGTRVAVLHSRLSEGERYDEWCRIRDGVAPVVLGTRSAVFAPLQNPGVILLDEEHDPSYKQDETPRYHARDVALKLAGLHNALVVFGSATPSLESYSRALPDGPYAFIAMGNRVAGRDLPPVKIVDMCQEGKQGNLGIFSQDLLKAMAERLQRKEQIILFLNRRGYSTYVVCRDCGLVLKCPHCDISLTYHASGRLQCHYCNYSLSFHGICPDCGEQHVGYFGTGTQKVEEEIRLYFPGVSILRMDGDTTTRKGSHGEILRAFREQEASILLGTQMVTKGLDLPGVTLVGVINADISLHMPDFRAAERTFQLLTQVSGRAGRGEAKGEVLVQTFSPAHYSIQLAACHDYPVFFEHEMKIRKMMQYPPFVRLARLLFWGHEEEVVNDLAQKAASLLELESSDDLWIVGPAPAPLTKVKDRYRYHILVKSRKGSILRKALQRVQQGMGRKNSKVSFVMDMDPQNLM